MNTPTLIQALMYADQLGLTHDPDREVEWHTTDGYVSVPVFFSGDCPSVLDVWFTVSGFIYGEY